ncbi:MAG: polysaccharide biosynthesis C-terminal domain-containing protein [Bacteroidales bacterium]|nr:polysaccharide biosynthesis C-terminal domain-containing protein [Bacteroidales bacterium]
MFKNIISTAGVRLLNAIIGFGIVLICTNALGSAVYGEIGLLLLLITLIIIPNDLIAGASIVYFSSRYKTWQVVVPAYVWSIMVAFMSGITFYILSFFPSIFHTIMPENMAIHVVILALFNSFSAIHQYLLIGNEKIPSYNQIFISQFIIQIFTLSCCIYLLQVKSIYAYVYSLYISYIFTWFLGIFKTHSLFERATLKGIGDRVLQFIKYGILIQLANLVQLGNRRFSFYVVKPYLGLSTLGVYNAALQLTEALRIISQSIAVVQYSRISNCHDEKYAADLTIKLMKFTVTLTFFAVCVLLIIPSPVFTWLFGNDFEGVKSVVIWLAPGVIFLSINAIFSHFFSGIGCPQHNTIGSGTGFILFLSLCFILIPKFGIVGAAATTSISYFGIIVYQTIIFKKRTKIPLKSFLITRSDFQIINEIKKELINKKNNL